MSFFAIAPAPVAFSRMNPPRFTVTFSPFAALCRNTPHTVSVPPTAEVFTA